MIIHTQPFRLSAFLLFAAVSVRAQDSLIASSRSLLQSSPVVDSESAGSGDYSPSSLVMIENRARTLGNQASGSGTRYFAARDFDLAGKTPEQVLQRLSPKTITAADHVRKMEVVIDLQRPFTLATTTGQAANIGTAVIQAAGLKQIEVNTNIFTSGLKVVKK